MTEQVNKYNWAFGKEIATETLNRELTNEILEAAFEHISLATRPDMKCILDIMQKVSECWADTDYHLRKKAQKILPE